MNKKTALLTFSVIVAIEAASSDSWAAPPPPTLSYIQTEFFRVGMVRVLTNNEVQFQMVSSTGQPMKFCANSGGDILVGILKVGEAGVTIEGLKEMLSVVVSTRIASKKVKVGTYSTAVGCYVGSIIVQE